MSEFTKSHIFGIVLVVVIIIVGGIFYLGSQEKKEGPSPSVSPSEKEAEEEGEQVMLSMAGIISEVNAEGSFLMVKPSQQEKEYKIKLSPDTEIIQLKFPFDPTGAPAEGTFTPERIAIGIRDLKVDDSVLIEAKTNMAGKTEIDDVTRIQVLP